MTRLTTKARTLASRLARRRGGRPAPALPVTGAPLPARGRVWATLGFVLGIAVSVAGNVAYTSYPSPEEARNALAAGEDWSAPIGAQLIAAFFPLALLVTVEVLARVPWPNTLGMSAARWGGAALVAGVAAIVSYGHLSSLLRVYGEDDLTAMIGPLSVDGLMVISGFALIAIGRHKSAHAATEPVREHVPEVPISGHVPDTSDGPTVVTPAPDGDASRPWEATVPEVLPEYEDAVATARERFAEALSVGEVPSVRQVMRALNVGHPKAVRIRGALEIQ